MMLDLNFITVRLDDPINLQSDILCFDLGETDFAHALAWINRVQREAVTKQSILPCLVVTGTPPTETELSQRLKWEDQLSWLTEAGAIFWDKRTFTETAQTWAAYQQMTTDYIMGEQALASSTRQEPPITPADSYELSEEVDLSIYVNPPFQLRDADFQELLNRTRDPMSRRED